MNDNASVTSLAITEKRPQRNGGCVGILFQLFDWNKKLAKKKLFSKRLLPPDRAKDGLKKFGGDEKQPKILLIADENSGGFPNKNRNGGNGVQTPNLVARLMGLESMPPDHHRDKLQKDGSSDFKGGRREKVASDNRVSEKESGSQEFRPQKVQKTGMVDRRSVTRFGAEALQLKHVLSQSRKSTSRHPKLALPVKSTGHHPKRNASRLIGAATRILEPGVQASNKSRYRISYRQGARKPLNGVGTEPVKGEDPDPLSGRTSCRNCGNLIDIVEPTSNGNNLRYNQEHEFSTDRVSIDRGRWQLADQQSPATYFKGSDRDQVKLNCFPYSSDTKDIVALNRSLSGRTRSRVPGKGEDMKFDKRGKFESARVSCLPTRPKRQVTHASRQGESCGVVSSSTNRFVWQPDYQGQIGNMNNDGMAFRFKSPTKNKCEVPRGNSMNASCKTASRKRFTSNPSDDKIRVQKPFPSTVAAYKLGVTRNPPKRKPANIFQELLCSSNMERLVGQNDGNHLHHRHSCRHHHCTGFCLQPVKSEKVEGFIRGKNSDHLCAGSVLEASFSNDSCCSSSLEDSSVRTQHADSMSYSYDDESQFQESETDPFYSHVLLRKEKTHNKLVADLLTYISQVLGSIDLDNFRMNRNIKEAIFNSELVLRNQMTHNPNETNSFFICDLILELDTLADVMWTRFGNILGSKNSGYQLKRFVFDSLIEYLESKYVQYAKCGFRTWINLPRFMGFGNLIRHVVEEVGRWMVVTSDELHVEMDMSHRSGKWTDFDIEAYEMGAKVEWDIVEMLIDEVVIDIMTGIDGFWV